jgi:hypothetical protein
MVNDYLKGSVRTSRQYKPDCLDYEIQMAWESLGLSRFCSASWQGTWPFDLRLCSRYKSSSSLAAVARNGWPCAVAGSRWSCITAASPIAHTSESGAPLAVITLRWLSVRRLKNTKLVRPSRTTNRVQKDYLLVFSSFASSVIEVMSGLGAKPVLHTRRPKLTVWIKLLRRE